MVPHAAFPKEAQIVLRRSALARLAAKAFAVQSPSVQSDNSSSTHAACFSAVETNIFFVVEGKSCKEMIVFDEIELL